MDEQKRKNPRRGSWRFCFTATFLFFLTAALWLTKVWFVRTFKYFNIRNLVFTLEHPIKGANIGVLFLSAGKYIVNVFELTLLAFCALRLMDYVLERFDLRLTWEQKRSVKSIRLLTPYRVCAYLTLVGTLAFLCVRTWNQLGVVEYLSMLREPTQIYEEEYIAPMPDSITTPPI